jgi:hypothetical protein
MSAAEKARPDKMVKKRPAPGSAPNEPSIRSYVKVKTSKTKSLPKTKDVFDVVKSLKQDKLLPQQDAARRTASASRRNDVQRRPLLMTSSYDYWQRPGYDLLYRTLQKITALPVGFFSLDSNRRKINNNDWKLQELFGDSISLASPHPQQFAPQKPENRRLKRELPDKLDPSVSLLSLGLHQQSSAKIKSRQMTDVHSSKLSTVQIHAICVDKIIMTSNFSKPSRQLGFFNGQSSN